VENLFMALFICDFANKKCLSGWYKVSIKHRVGLTAGLPGNDNHCFFPDKTLPP
jgi:hypothetical protein